MIDIPLVVSMVSDHQLEIYFFFSWNKLRWQLYSRMYVYRKNWKCFQLEETGNRFLTKFPSQLSIGNWSNYWSCVRNWIYAQRDPAKMGTFYCQTPRQWAMAICSPIFLDGKAKVEFLFFTISQAIPSELPFAKAWISSN